jgi:4-hydroxybenzoate polyprenyltransferase
MAFNRWADARIDLENPRTRGRAVPAGLLRRSTMGAAAALSAAGFVGVCSAINPLALALSPLALAVILGYSFTKRFTWLSHAVLGLALGLSPLGAWVAVRGEVALIPALLGLAVLLWTAGFDIIYACQDAAFDTRAGLHSIPARFGIRNALGLSRAFHGAVILLLAIVGRLAGLGWAYALGVLCVAVLLVREHSVVSADDLSRVDMAFFTLNGLVSLAFMASVIIETVI